MYRKTVSAIMLALILTSMFTLASNILNVTAADSDEFWATAYYCVYGSEMSGTQTVTLSISGLTFTLKASFLFGGYGVAMQGTGRTGPGGDYVHYVGSGGAFVSVDDPIGDAEVRTRYAALGITDFTGFGNIGLAYPGGAVYSLVSGVTGASGRTLAPWYSIAVDPSTISLGVTGTLLFKSGYTTPGGATEMGFRADDTGGAITGNRIDVYVGEGVSALNEWYQTGGNRYVGVTQGWGKSHKVAVVDDYYGSAVGSIYPSDYPNQVFSALSALQVSAGTLASYDTVILFMFNPSGLTAAQKAAINDWVYKGGKLMIWDSDQVPPGHPWDYTWLSYPFTTSTPGQTGAHTGKLEVMEENQLSSSDPSSPCYINTDTLVHYTDAVGDATVLVTHSPGWRIDMMATNVLGQTGPAHAYAAYGSGLMTYSALDWDNAGSWSGWSPSNPGVWLKKLLKQELDCSNLPFIAPPVLGEVGLKVEVTSEASEGYYANKPINLKATVTNPTVQTGINIIAYNVELTIIVPEEIEVYTTTLTVGDIRPGESKTVTFSGTIKKAGESVEVIANARGEDRTLSKTIAGSGSCFITVHGTETPRADWSFAIITDLHIGYGRGLQRVDSDADGKSVEVDYGGFGWDDSELAPDKGKYEITDRLANAIAKILVEKSYYNIKFVVVLGDISDTAEKSEFFKARELLNRLNDNGMPYIPLIGNHDIWPYTQDTGDHGVFPISESGNNDRSHYADIAHYARGDQFFKEVFWGESNSLNKQLIRSLFGDSWTYTYDKPVRIKGGLLEACVYDFDEQHKNGNNYYDYWDGHKHFTSREQDFYLQNYGFTYGGITFACLDLAPRLGEDRDALDGNAIPGSVRGGVATSHPQTQEFSKNYFKNHPSDSSTAVLLSHYPLGDGVFDYIAPYSKSTNQQEYGRILNFYGHVHNTFTGSTTYSPSQYVATQIGDVIYDYVDTQDLANIEVPVITEPKLRTQQPIRIVSNTGGSLDYSKTLAPAEKVNPQWSCPEFSYTHGSYPAPNKEITFTAFFTTYYGFMTSFNWDFGDGIFASGSSAKHLYTNEGTYTVALTVTTKNLVTNVERNQTVTSSVFVHYKHVIVPPSSGLATVSPFTREDFELVPQNTWEPVIIEKYGPPDTPIAILNVRFDDASRDIILSDLLADVDIEGGKSIIYTPTWPAEIDQYKQLFVPSTGAGAVYICLGATSLEDVSLENADVILNVGETKDGITVTTTFYNGREYYLVSGVTGTGGGELSDTTPPTTTITVGEPKYASGTVYVTPATTFTINSNDDASGVNRAEYRIYNSTDFGWVTYTGPFNLGQYSNGNYTIAYRSIDNAGNIEDNPNNYVNITLVRAHDCLGDVTGDGHCDIFDIVAISNVFGRQAGDSDWNPIMDIIEDSTINVFDIVKCVLYYGM